MPKARKDNLPIITVFVILLFLAGCKSEITAINSIPAAQPQTVTLQSTLTPIPKKTTIITLQPTPTIRKTYKYISPKFAAEANSMSEVYYSLSYGQYVLYTSNEGLFAISMDGKSKFHLSNNISGIPISTDGRLLQLDSGYNYIGKTLSFITGEIDKISTIGQISPDKTWIAKKDNKCTGDTEYVIRITNIIDGNTICMPLGYYFNPDIELFMNEVQWSKDGQYLQYMIIPIFSPFTRETPLDTTKPMYGIYQMDTNCLHDLETCSDHITKIANIHEEMHFESSLEFSPDNKIAAVNTGVKFIIIDLQSNEQHTIINPSTGIYNSYHYAISPDNQWLAYSGDGSNIMIQSIHRGNANKIAADLNHVTVLGWLTGPYLQTGDSFKVLPAGDHVNIREKPDLDAAELTFLISGNTFTVLDGPIQEDGYTWWYVDSDVDGVEGWISEFYDLYEKVGIE